MQRSVPRFQVASPAAFNNRFYNFAADGTPAVSIALCPLGGVGHEVTLVRRGAVIHIFDENGIDLVSANPDDPYVKIFRAWDTQLRLTAQSAVYSQGISLHSNVSNQCMAYGQHLRRLMGLGFDPVVNHGLTSMTRPPRRKFS